MPRNAILCHAMLWYAMLVDTWHLCLQTRAVKFHHSIPCCPITGICMMLMVQDERVSLCGVSSRVGAYA